MRILVVGEQISEAGPADERVRGLFVVFLRHIQENGFEQEISFNFMPRLTIQDVAHLTEQPEFEQLFTADGRSPRDQYS